MATQSQIRVVVVDDSPFICRLITHYLHATGDFQVVAAALNGARALELVEKHHPDVVTMDVDMPRMGGLEALRHLMRDNPVPVVMISGVGRKAAEITLEALKAGAVDFILKAPLGKEVNADTLRLEIISKVRAASKTKVIRSLAPTGDNATLTILPSKKAAAALKQARKIRRERDERKKSGEPSTLLGSGVVVIGASTGGPIALRELISALPADFLAPIIIVQHIPENFDEVLAVQLNKQSLLPVRLAVHGEKLAAGLIYIAPGGSHLLLKEDSTIELSRSDPIRGHRPSIDVAMQSVAQCYGPLARGVILTGMGDDGSRGIKAIHNRGGVTYAQDEATCVVDSMPRHARLLGGVSASLTPFVIGQALAGVLDQAEPMVK